MTPASELVNGFTEDEDPVIRETYERELERAGAPLRTLASDEDGGE